MKKILPIFILLLALSCSVKKQKVIDFGQFKITVPKNWNKHKAKGIDSYIGGIITDTNDTLNFDFGMYSNDASKAFPMVYDKESLAELTKRELKLLPSTKHLIVEDFFESRANLKEYLKYEIQLEMVDCYKVKMIKPNNKGFGITGIYIDSISGSKLKFDKIKFNFYGHFLKDKTQAEFLKALKTLTFKNCNEK